MKALIWFLLGGCAGCIGSYLYMSKKLKNYQQESGLVGCDAIDDSQNDEQVNDEELVAVAPGVYTVGDINRIKKIREETVVANETANTVDIYAYDEKITINKPDTQAIIVRLDKEIEHYSMSELIDKSETDRTHIFVDPSLVMTTPLDINGTTMFHNGIRFDIFCDEDINSITKDDVDWVTTQDYASESEYNSSRLYPMVTLHICDTMTIDDIITRIIAHGYIMHVDATGNDQKFKKFKDYLKIAPPISVYYISAERADELRDYPYNHATTDIILLSDGVYVDEECLADIPVQAINEMFETLEPETDTPGLLRGYVDAVIIRNERRREDYRITFLEMDFETYLNGRPINYSKYNNYM